MKHLKMSICLLLTAAFFTGCEKETTSMPENSEINNERSSPKIMVVHQWDKEFEGMKNLNSKISKTQSSISHLDNSGSLTYFNNPEIIQNLTCNNLLFENFSEVNIGNGGIGTTGPWSSSTNNGFILPGYIEPGIVFHASDASETVENTLGIFGPGWWFMEDGQTNALMAWYDSSKLILDFPIGNVYTVGFKNYPMNMQNINIEIFGNSGSLGSTTLINAYKGTYFGVNSNEPITKIVIDYGSNNFNGIDDITFGNCSGDLDADGIMNEVDLCANTPFGETVNGNGCAQSQLDDDNDGVLNPNDQCSNTPSGESVNENGCGQSQLDYDGDGVMNNKDAHIYSILGGDITIGGCYPNVRNVLVKNGSTMMDQITDLTAQINSEYNGQNYKTLHSKFVTKLAQITYGWRTAKLITATQRSQISTCASNANIPYTNWDE
ncbi:MAG: hypothetical protein Q7T92_11040 [Lutibacter sp.]|nr:hypothetical protein [Lutibacter sp.]